MPDSASTEHSVEIIIEGIIMLLYERDEEHKITACVAGVVRDVPEHEFTVKGRKFLKDGSHTDFSLDPTKTELRLDVQGTTMTGIRFYREGDEVDRLCGEGDQQSFSWVLDFERGELYDREIGVDVSKFRSILRINNGELYTEKISENHLLVRYEDTPNEPCTLIGKVATKVGVRLKLDTPESVARFSDGASEPIVVGHGERLRADVKLICPTEDQRTFGQRSAHANNYYKAVGHKLGWGEKKLFSSTKFDAEEGGSEGPPVSPEASCLVGTGTKSAPNE